MYGGISNGCTRAACFFILVNFFLVGPIRSDAEIHILPEPVRIVERTGVFGFTNDTRILMQTNDPWALHVAKGFAREWKDATGISLQLLLAGDSNTKNIVVFILRPDPEIKSAEGYRIDITTNRIHISSPGAAGLFYAWQTIKQLLPPDFFAKTVTGRKVNIPCAEITDYPQFNFRGMHLDVSRHFFGISFIKKYLDILASYKINEFHWHLTDSHGWRLEIKQYPRLVTVGAWRADRTGIPMTIALPTAKDESVPYGGFYTQDQVREIIQYAKERFIDIIPEIEMPGHCEAALVAYPQYNCLNNPIPLLMPCGYAGDLTHNFCVGNDSTFIFLENILTEVASLFPGPFIHIGGDEVRKEPWETCPRCQRKMRELGFGRTSQLQDYFTSRMDSFVTTLGKRAIGWDDILQARLSPSTAVMSWHGNAGIQLGHDIVMTPFHYTYFDFYQSDPQLEPDITYATLFLDTVYAFNPTDQIKTEEAKRILGAEACLWTENVATEERVEYMLLPRLLALSEVLWSPSEKKNYDRFISKTEESFKRFDAENIHYAKSLYNVAIQPKYDSTANKVVVVLSDQAGKYQIRYTTEGSSPTPQAMPYTNPVVAGRMTLIRAQLFNGERKMGKISMDSFLIHKATGMDLVATPSDSEISANSKKLLDGIFGTIEPDDGRWVYFHNSKQVFSIDIGKIQNVRQISIRCLEDQVGNIYLPKSITFALSVDGQKYTSVYNKINKKLPQELLRHIVQFKMNGPDRQARYIRVTIDNANPFTDPTKNQWMMDEIVVQ
jgi:hexosaminidase